MQGAVFVKLFREPLPCKFRAPHSEIVEHKAFTPKALRSFGKPLYDLQHPCRLDLNLAAVRGFCNCMNRVAESIEVDIAVVSKLLSAARLAFAQ